MKRILIFSVLVFALCLIANTGLAAPSSNSGTTSQEQLPDLLIRKVVAPSIIRLGAVNTFRVEFANIGEMDITDEFVLRFHLDTDGAENAPWTGYSSLNKAIYIDSLNVGEYTQRFEMTIPERAKIGFQNLVVTIDHWNRIEERDETNNVFTLPVLIEGERISEELEILDVSCPSTFPKPYQEIDFEITIRNNSNFNSVPRPLGLFREVPGNRTWTEVKISEAMIESIPAGETRTFNLTYLYRHEIYPTGVYISYGEGSLEDRIIGFGFYNQDNAEISYPIDVFCKKHRSDLALEVTHSDSIYGETGRIAYEISVTNNGLETAHNLQVVYLEAPSNANILKETNWSNSYFLRASEIRYWQIPTLGVGERATINVIYYISKEYHYPSPPELAEEFTLSGLKVIGGHLIDENLENNQAPPILFRKSDAYSEFIDLELSLPNPPPSISEGEEEYFKFYLKNTGSIDATGVALQLDFLEADAEIIGQYLYGSTFMDNTWSNLHIPIGKEVQISVRILAKVPNLNIKASIVAADQVDIDSSPDNPDETEDDTVVFNSGSNLPDLTLQNIESPLQFPAGEVSRFGLDIANIGRTNVQGDFEIAFVLSEDEEWDEEDIVIGTIPTGNLGIGSFRTTAAVNIPTTVMTGNYNLIAVIDANADIEETNESNNYNIVPVIITGDEDDAQFIDLELSLQTNNPTIGQWQRGTFTLTLENKGQQDASNIFVHLLPFGTNEAQATIVGGTEILLSSGTVEVGETIIWSVARLPANEQANITFQLFSKVPNLSFPAYVAAVDQVDIDSTPSNTDEEEDDFVRFTTSMPLPDLRLQNIESPLQFPVGEVSRFELELVNSGTASVQGDFEVSFVISEDEELSEDDVVVGTIVTGNFGIDVYPSTAAVDIPANIALGTQFLIATIDASEQIAENDETNNTQVQTIRIINGNRFAPPPSQPKQSISIVPNPASESIYVRGLDMEETSYTIYDIYGRRIKTGQLYDNAIPIKHLLNGTYYLRVIVNKGQSYPLRFVKVE